MHVGGSPLQLDKAWINNGRPPVKDWMGGGENLRTKDIAVLHQGPETFLSMMLIDGVFERFPKLRGGCIELGAGWVPAMLVRLDWTVKIWSKTDANLARFTRKPSEQLTQQMAFTPFVFEDIGALIDQSNPDLYLFSTDYPHTEGGRNPIARFETSLGDRSEQIRDRFYRRISCGFFLKRARPSDTRQFRLTAAADLRVRRRFCVRARASTSIMLRHGSGACEELPETGIRRMRVAKAFAEHSQIAARYVHGILEVRLRHQYAMKFRQPIERNARVEVMLDVVVHVLRRDKDVLENGRAGGPGLRVRVRATLDSGMFGDAADAENHGHPRE